MERENMAGDFGNPKKISEKEERIKTGIDALLDRIILPLKKENAALKSALETQQEESRKLFALLCRIIETKAD